MYKKRRSSGTIKISEARARLPELARYVSGAPDRVVRIEHRDLTDGLVLTTERYLDFLMTRIRELEEQAAVPFRLAGSLKTTLSDAELEQELQTIRQEQRKLQDDKLRSLAE